MRHRVEVAERPDALYALWNGQMFRAQRSTTDSSVLLTPLAGEDAPEEFDTEARGTRGKVVPAEEAPATFALHTYCLRDDEPYLVEPTSDDGELILRWTGTDEQRAHDLGLTDFTTRVQDPDTITALWQERHDFAAAHAPRTEPGTGEVQPLLKAIGQTLLGFLPSGWQRVAAQFRQVGDYSELEVKADAGEDTAVSLSAPPQLGQLMSQLRSAMYTPEDGTWFQGTYALDPERNFDFDYDTTGEPQWQLPPAGRRTARTYDAELEYFPRKDPPPWLAAKAGKPLDVEFRHAHIVDSGGGEGEQPVVNRPPLPQEEIPRVLGYLFRAPVVLARQGGLRDLFAPQGAPHDVPDAFHTDGTWVWPAAVPHYLRKYGVPPEQDLLDAIRAKQYTVPYASRSVRATAEADLLGKPRPPRAPEDVAEPSTVTKVQRGEEPRRLRASEVLSALRLRLAEHGIADSAFRIGETADDAWCLHRAVDGWEVARYADGVPVEPRHFARVHDAAEALLGALLLLPGRMGAGTSAEQQHPTDWPIQPVRGEPPLPFFRNKRMVTLPVGMRLRRFGGEQGNLLHPDRTPFPETSLPVEREGDLRTFVVKRPVHVLTGVTSPWGPLPGGAVAYLLPNPVGAHVESGALERV
ncbi:TNT domain-containing protein [Prauserella halophila]|uniref:TNT domain-containing protein n=1 Tax=Prauserella halophila TaxID=185641 RepID=UPI0020A41A29|nr:TNT domain-containing protein [Prauserella halophila]MCP2236679.1 Protein of unknown function (DUF4237) [Prauserella halophila]